MSKEFSRRSFLQLSTAIVAQTLPPLRTEPRRYENPFLVRRKGILHMYSSNEHMDAQVGYRFGIDEDLFWNSDAREVINSAQTYQDLLEMSYGGKQIVTNKEFYYRMLAKLGNEGLSVIQGVTDENKTRPYFIAPDTYMFYPENYSHFYIGKKALISVDKQISEDGSYQNIPSQTYTAYIIDVKDQAHHTPDSLTLGDTDPYFWNTVLGGYWNEEIKQFTTQAGVPIIEAPVVSVEF